MAAIEPGGLGTAAYAKPAFESFDTQSAGHPAPLARSPFDNPFPPPLPTASPDAAPAPPPPMNLAGMLGSTDRQDALPPSPVALVARPDAATLVQPEQRPRIEGLFEYLDTSTPAQIATLIQRSGPATAALVLTNLPEEIGKQVIAAGSQDPEYLAQVAMRRGAIKNLDPKRAALIANQLHELQRRMPVTTIEGSARLVPPAAPLARVGPAPIESPTQLQARLAQRDVEEQAQRQLVRDTLIREAQENPDKVATGLRSWIADKTEPSHIATIDNLAHLTGRQKAAILLIGLGSEPSVQVLKKLREEDVEAVTMAIFRERFIPQAVTDAVMQEAHEVLIGPNFASGGEAFAKDALARAFGPQKAAEMLQSAEARKKPFGFLYDVDPQNLVNTIQNEHPQIIALTLSHLRPDQAALVITGLHPNVQADVAMRIANMDWVPANIINEVQRTLHRKLANNPNVRIGNLISVEGLNAVGGVKKLVEILQATDSTSQKTIMDSLDESHPELADEIKKNMFTFDEIVKLSDADLREILKNPDIFRDLPRALRGASEEVRQRFYGERVQAKVAADKMKEDIEILGPQRLSTIEDAQQRIVAVVRRLNKEGDITIPGSTIDTLNTYAEDKARADAERARIAAIETQRAAAEQARVAAAQEAEAQAQAARAAQATQPIPAPADVQPAPTPAGEGVGGFFDRQTQATEPQATAARAQKAQWWNIIGQQREAAQTKAQNTATIAQARQEAERAQANLPPGRIDYAGQLPAGITPGSTIGGIFMRDLQSAIEYGQTPIRYVGEAEHVKTALDTLGYTYDLNVTPQGTTLTNVEREEAQAPAPAAAAAPPPAEARPAITTTRPQAPDIRTLPADQQEWANRVSAEINRVAAVEGLAIAAAQQKVLERIRRREFI